MSTEAARITQLLRLAVKYYKPFYICKHNATNLRSRKYFLELSPKSMKFSDSQTYSSLAWTRDWGDYANIWNRTNNWRQRTLTVDPSWHYGWLYSLQVIDFLSLTPLRIVATAKINVECCTSLTGQEQVLGATVFPAWVFAWECIFSWDEGITTGTPAVTLTPSCFCWVVQRWNTIVPGSMAFFSAFGAPATLPECTRLCCGRLVRSLSSPAALPALFWGRKFSVELGMPGRKGAGGRFTWRGSSLVQPH